MLLHCIIAFLSDWEKSVWSLKDGLSHFLTQVDATAVLNEGGKPFTHNKERAHSCSKAYFLWNLKRFHVISRVLLKLCQDPRSLVWQNSKIKKKLKDNKQLKYKDKLKDKEKLKEKEKLKNNL